MRGGGLFERFRIPKRGNRLGSSGVVHGPILATMGKVGVTLGVSASLLGCGSRRA